MADLRAGAAEVDITPPLGTSLQGYFEDRKAHDVDDPLHAKAVVFDDGRTRLALVVLDVIALGRADVLAIRERAQALTGIPGEHIFVGCTHTHTGPATTGSHAVPRADEYCRWLAVRVADSVQLAARRLAPARLAWGKGELPEHVFCRRYRMRDGTVRMNPGRGNPDIVAATSPTDPGVGVLYIEHGDGRPLAAIAQYSLHYVGTDDSLSISADYYGHFAVAMRRALGAECVPLLFNGTSGQINNIDPFDPAQPHGRFQAKRVAQALAGETLKVIGRLRPVGEAALGVSTQLVELPRKRLTEEDMAVARQILAGSASAGSKAAGTATGDAPHVPERGPFSWVVGQPIPPNLRPIYAQRCVDWSQRPERLATEVQVLRIGDSAWVSLPGEIFVEMGLAIKAASQTSFTYVVGLANDALGYIATDRAYAEEGGYETWTGPVGAGAEGVLVAAAGRGLAELFG